MVEHKNNTKISANLYCMLDTKKYLHKESNITISNGLCWSPDSDKMYFADSAAQEIYVYDFDKVNANNINKRIFVITNDNCYLDGVIVDKDGFIWSAQWGGSQIIRYTPKWGERLYT